MSQALWGHALDYGAINGGRTIFYRDVVRQGLAAEGPAAFCTTKEGPNDAARLCDWSSASEARPIR